MLKGKTVRIPAEAATVYFSDTKLKSSADKQKTKPVNDLAGLRATNAQVKEPLDEATQKDRSNQRAEKKADLSREYRGDERRYHERRQTHLAALLDTRLQRGRRTTDQSDDHPAINLEI